MEVRLASGKTLKSTMFYSPVDLPWKASIEPGETYVREIRPVRMWNFTTLRSAKRAPSSSITG